MHTDKTMKISVSNLRKTENIYDTTTYQAAKMFYLFNCSIEIHMNKYTGNFVRDQLSFNSKSTNITLNSHIFKLTIFRKKFL